MKRPTGGVKRLDTALDSPWLNLMRNAPNTQIWSFRHADFLCVSATHGTAHLAILSRNPRRRRDGGHPMVRDLQKPIGEGAGLSLWRRATSIGAARLNEESLAALLADIGRMSWST
jgi:hypothetical protein